MATPEEQAALAHAQYTNALTEAEAAYAPYGAAIQTAQSEFNAFEERYLTYRRKLLRAIEDAFDAAIAPGRAFEAARTAAHDALLAQNALVTAEPT